MESYIYQQNMGCAKRVQHYLTRGLHILEGVFRNGNLIGLFHSKSSIPIKYLDMSGCSIIPISYNKVSPTYTDSDYTSNKNQISLIAFDILKEHDEHGAGTIGWIDLLFVFIMQNPDLTASHPPFRNVFNDRINEFKMKLTGNLSHKFHNSHIILNDAPQFLDGIKQHIHYTEQIVKSSPKRHNFVRDAYNLRPRKPINYAEFDE